MFEGEPICELEGINFKKGVKGGTDAQKLKNFRGKVSMKKLFEIFSS